MALKGRVYYCTICGQKVKVVQEGGGILVCCGKDMDLTDE